MLEHLLDSPLEALEPLDKSAPAAILDAQVETAQWLEEMGAPTKEGADAAFAASLAKDAFTALTTNAEDPKKRAALVAMKTPMAVRHLVGMLTAYDWEFVEQAKQLRGYAVSQILEETKHPDAKIRLRALEMLGKVTEVALFTDRVEIKKTELSDNDLDTKIKEKLNRFMGVTDAKITDLPSETA